MSGEMTAAAGEDAGEISLHDELAAALGADEPPAPDAAPSPETSEPRPPRAAGEPSVFDAAGAQPAPAEAKTIAPPPSWSATAKAEFAALPEVIRQEVLKREADIERGKAQLWNGSQARLNALEVAAHQKGTGR